MFQPNDPDGKYPYRLTSPNFEDQSLLKTADKRYLSL